MAEVSTFLVTSSNSAREVLPEMKLLSASKYSRALGPRFFISWLLSVAVDESDIVGWREKLETVCKIVQQYYVENNHLTLPWLGPDNLSIFLISHLMITFGPRQSR